MFAGYGVSASGHDDYAGLDVAGRVVLVLDGAPPFLTGPPPSRLDKLIAARRRGAVAMLIAGEGLPALESTSAPVNLVSGTLTAATTDALLAPSGLTRAALARRAAESRAPAPLATGVEVGLRVDLQEVEVRTANVIGVVPGHDPARSTEAVVVGAHYDHLGRSGGVVYPGADDNASGTAVVLELARTFASAGGTARTLVFVLFSGEELGLLGSRHYIRNPTVPIERTVAMINLDMVGRLGDRPLGVGGVATGGGLKTVMEDAGRQVGLALADRDAPGGASDHAPFYGAGVPVLFFHTGAHPDYHRPTDTADKIDADGLARVAAVAARVVEDVAGGPRPTYVALPPQPPRSPGAPGPTRRGLPRRVVGACRALGRRAARRGRAGRRRRPGRDARGRHHRSPRGGARAELRGAQGRAPGPAPGRPRPGRLSSRRGRPHQRRPCSESGRSSHRSGSASNRQEDHMIDVSVNGKTQRIDADPDTPLLWVIRESLGLTGTKYGCGMALCGACTVHLDGSPVRSCVTPVSAARGKRVTTIEGLAQGTRLHPVQDAWIEQDVPQCGYCQSGQVMSAVALLSRQKDPTDADIDVAMSGNICRCGTYQRIRAAIKLAAARMRKGA